MQTQQTKTSFSRPKSYRHFRETGPWSLMRGDCLRKVITGGGSSIKLLHSVFIGEAHTALSYLINKPCTAYNLRRSNNIIVPRFNSQFLKNSISHRGAILWNAVSSHFTDQFTVFYRKVKKDSYFKELDFSAKSVQSLPRHYQDFKCF